MSNTTEPREVKVQILLNGGHQYTLYIQSDTPLLLNLIKILIARTQSSSQQPILFQIPLNEGRSTLTFSSEQLVGMITEPPVVVQEQKVSEIIAPTPPKIISSVPKSSPIKTPENVNKDLESRYLQLDNFLTPQENQELIKYVIDNQSQFVTTSTSTNADSYRRSMVLYSFPKYSDLILKRLKKVVKQAMKDLEIPEFEMGEIESQLTMHNDGNFYKIHNDSGSSDTASRIFTYVYYFYREPKAFTGGELLLYDSKIENNFYVAADTYHVVEPRNNSVVFFLSRYLHEVLPVTCPSKDFADSRFTINGWIRHK
jgi:SM-20-related protein